MKIVLVNYRYFFSGGPERYLFNIKEVLEKKGHEVIPYSIQHKKNIKSKYEDDFLSPIGTGDEIYFSDIQKEKTFATLRKGFSRMVYSFEAKTSFKNFLLKHKPDIIYILYYQNKISCSIVDAAYEVGIPVVHRISDYSLVVPCSMMYNQRTRNLCEKCLYKSKMNAIKEKCIYNSYVYSFTKVLALVVQRIMKTKEKTNAYIFPSAFTLSKFIEAGFDRKKLFFVPTLFNKSSLNTSLEIEWQNFAIYIGRVDPDKGIKTLLDAFIDTEYNLKIIGYTSKDYLVELKDYLKGKKHNIEFLGKMSFNEMQIYLSKCLFTIIPSEWYDNLPNTLIESFAFNKCVVASNIGSLAENIQDGKNGLLFECKNSTDLKTKIQFLFKNKNKAIEFGKNAYKLIESKFSVEQHYKELIKVFNDVIKNKQRK